MIIKGDAHKHDYQKLVLIPCIARDRPMGILARVCECGDKEAFDYGNRNDMKEKGVQYAKDQKARLIREEQDRMAREGPSGGQEAA